MADLPRLPKNRKEFFASSLTQHGSSGLAPGFPDTAIGVVGYFHRQPYDGTRTDLVRSRSPSDACRVGVANLLRSRIDEAIVWLKRAQAANDEHPAPRAWLAAAYGVKGETQQAFAELTAARKMSGDDRYSSIARLRSSGMRAPKVRALFEATYFAGLRRAGMPEE